jgi:hypothetical protein
METSELLSSTLPGNKPVIPVTGLTPNTDDSLFNLPSILAEAMPKQTVPQTATFALGSV